MPVLQPKEMNDFDKSVAIFDFPDDSSLSQQEEATAPRRNLSRTKRKRTEPTTTKTSKSEKENKKSTSSQEAEKYGTKRNIAVCPICRHESIDEETRTLHSLECSGFKTKSKKSPNDIPSCSKNMTSSSSAVTKSKMVDETSVENTESDSNVCPICSKPFTNEESASDKERHINKCLDSPYDDKGTMENDEILARSLQLEEEQVNSELSVCHICLKDLSKLTAAKKNRHHNVCMDKVDLFEGKKKRNNPTRKVKTTQPRKRATKIPRKSCPICHTEQPENVRLFWN